MCSKKLIACFGPCEKVSHSPHSLSNRACKSKVLKINDVIFSDDNDNFDSEGVKERKQQGPTKNSMSKQLWNMA